MHVLLAQLAGLRLQGGPSTAAPAHASSDSQEIAGGVCPLPATESSSLQAELPAQLRDQEAAVWPLLLAQLWHWAEAAPTEQSIWVGPQPLSVAQAPCGIAG